MNTYVYQTTPDVDDPAPRHNYDGVETRGVARDAEDDQIMLDGIGAIIFAPAGRGAAVLDALEREIARGWSPKR